MTKQEIEVYNSNFVNALEFVEPVILDKTLKFPRVFVNMIPRGTYGLGRGLVQKQDIFHGETTVTTGLSGWQLIQPYRPAAGDDPGYNPCKTQEAELVEHGFEEQTWTGYQRARRTYDICINEVKWIDRFQEQIRLVFENLGDITLAEWDNIGRESYMQFSKKHVVSIGSSDSISFTYDSFTSTNITMAKGVPVGMISFKWMQWWHQYLSLQAGPSATGNNSGMPTWTMVVDPADMTAALEKDPQFMEFMKYDRPRTMLENYGQVEMYKGYTFAYNMNMPRYAPVSQTSTTVTLQRVEPQLRSQIAKGYKWTVNPAYMNAPYAVGYIYLKDTVELQVPPAGPATAGGGTKFGVQPNLMGNFMWMNIIDPKENRYGEIGHYENRMQAFVKPLRWSGEGITFLYKRDVGVDIVLTDPRDAVAKETTDGTDVLSTSVATPVYEAPYTATNCKSIIITLASVLPVEGMTEVKLTHSTNVDVNAIIADDKDAPTYRLVFESAANYVALCGAAGACKVNVI